MSGREPRGKYVGRAHAKFERRRGHAPGASLRRRCRKQRSGSAAWRLGPHAAGKADGRQGGGGFSPLNDGGFRRTSLGIHKHNGLDLRISCSSPQAKIGAGAGGRQHRHCAPPSGANARLPRPKARPSRRSRGAVGTALPSSFWWCGPTIRSPRSDQLRGRTVGGGPIFGSTDRLGGIPKSR